MKDWKIIHRTRFHLEADQWKQNVLTVPMKFPKLLTSLDYPAVHLSKQGIYRKEMKTLKRSVIWK